TWPIRLVWVLMMLVFFAAGLSKITLSGVEWIVSDNMGFLFLRQYYSNDPLTAGGWYIAQYPRLCQLIALGTVVIEIGAPLALISRGLRLLIVPGLLAMQVGIWVLMGTAFLPFFFTYHFWVPWDRLGRWITTRLQGHPQSLTEPKL
ncbi:MAG: hypothetical protein OEU26_23690, partial [Candidatus Tectomicrobia bacterium]|nr:hypothetical protein [Candidatus Tectomicrobia bacterium]